MAFSSSQESNAFYDIDLAYDPVDDSEDGYNTPYFLFYKCLVKVFLNCFDRYGGTDLGTLHLTLPESLWDRHEQRPPVKSYKPTRSFSRYKPTLSNWLPVRTDNK